MHVKPEHKTIGKQNYEAVVSSEAVRKRTGREVTRRDFLKGAAAGGVAAATLGGAYFGYSSIERPLRVGVIGCGDEGNVLIGAINPNYIQVVAIADIRPYNVHRTFHGDISSPNALKHRPGLLRVYDWKGEDEARRNVKVYDDLYDELLKDSDVEGVIIALPLHLHAEAAIKAMRAGKHVLTEKLMGHSVRECKEMARASYATGQLLATGHQRHYNVLYEEAVDLIRMGLLGGVHHIRAQWHRGNLPDRDSWKPSLPIAIDGEKNLTERLTELKKELDELAADLKLEGKSRPGKELKRNIERRRTDVETALRLVELQMLDKDVKAENYGYQSITVGGRQRPALEELIRWRLWNRTGGGLMAELGSHQLDASSIFISALRKDGKKVLPLNVSAVGGRYLFPEDRDSDDHVYCTYEFPGIGYFDENQKVADPNKKVVVTYSSINGNGLGGYGEVVMGTQGTLILEREEESMLIPSSGAATSVRVREASGPVLDTTASGAAAEAVAGGDGGPVSKGYREEMEHWAWCIRNFDAEGYKAKRGDYENNVRCHPAVALADAVIALTSNIAMKPQKDGRPLTRIDFKSEWFDIDSDELPPGEEGKPPKHFETA
jgi:predicted dehydrogenase